jgi:hypothetical protein
MNDELLQDINRKQQQASAVSSIMLFGWGGSVLTFAWGIGGLLYWKQEPVGAVTYTLLALRPEALALIGAMAYLVVLHGIRYFWMFLDADEFRQYRIQPLITDACIRWNSRFLLYGLLVNFLVWGTFATKSPETNFVLPIVTMVFAVISEWLSAPYITWNLEYVGDPNWRKVDFSKSTHSQSQA